MFKKLKKTFNAIGALWAELKREEILKADKYADDFLLAVENGDIPAIKAHYDGGGDPKDALSRFALHAGASVGNAASVTFLLEMGVPPTSRWIGETAIAAAEKEGHQDIVKILREASQINRPASPKP